MKRICLFSCALGAVALAPTVASAEPAILYIPAEEIILQAGNEGDCAGSGAPNSGRGCTGIVDGETPVPAFGGDMDALMAGLDTALADFDVHITNERPPEYVAYTMMLPEAPVELISLSCSAGGINCGARKRNGIIFMVDGTQNCTAPDLVHSALYAFGRASGLEGVLPPEDMAAPLDVMTFPPDYTMPLLEYTDQCLFREHQQTFDDAGMPAGEANLECTFEDHVGRCPADPDDDAGQNSYQDLLAYYETRVEDTTPPELTNVVPEDGAVIMAEGGSGMLGIDVDIVDDDPVVGARWTIQSDALTEDFEGGIITLCTNDLCTIDWPDANPLKPTDSDWAIPGELGLPPGEYAITLEAADFHGNVAEPVSFTVTIMGEPDAGSSTGDVTDPTNADNTGDMSASSGDDDSGGTTGQDEDPSGCTCRTTPAPGGAVLMLLGLLGLGGLRRRW